MKNPVGRLKTAWYNRLNGNVSYNSASIPVFREDANMIPDSHYILIRAAGSRNERTSDAFIKKVSLFIQVVTKFSGAEGINDSVVDEIDEQIQNLINPTVLDDGLTDGDYFQILNVNPEDETYETFIDTDQSIKYHIKTTRWEHQAVEKL
jgi:hypothetical protein